MKAVANAKRELRNAKARLQRARNSYRTGSEDRIRIVEEFVAYCKLRLERAEKFEAEMKEYPL